MNHQTLVEHTFRHEYGKIVASLARRVGSRHLETVEDAVQFAMVQALDAWVRKGCPAAPTAWLYQVAYRKLVSDFRTARRRHTLLNELLNELSTVHPDNGHGASHPEPDVPLHGEMTDALLRMLFMACNDLIPVESQLVFTLKSLCGFSVNEIAHRLFISEANVYKRYSRARQYLERHVSSLDALSDSDASTRLPMVLKTLYLLFTEGYLSSHSDLAIRTDLCEEAVRLTALLSESRLGKMPETFALLALMQLHLARMPARQDCFGALLLLEQQDRRQWDQIRIAKGLAYLQQSAVGDAISQYHVEAGIAATHCLAATLAETKWDRIVSSYTLLERIAPSPMIYLNKAIAIAQWQGAEAGLASLFSVDMPDWFEKSYHWYAVQADLFFRCGKLHRASDARLRAIQLAPTGEIKRLLQNRFDTYDTA